MAPTTPTSASVLTGHHAQSCTIGSSDRTPHRGGDYSEWAFEHSRQWGRLELHTDHRRRKGDGRPAKRRTVARGAGPRVVRGGRVEHGEGVRVDTLIKILSALGLELAVTKRGRAST